VNVVTLKYRAVNVSGVGVAALQALDCGRLVAKGLQKREREASWVKFLLCQQRYSFFNFNSVQA